MNVLPAKDLKVPHFPMSGLKQLLPCCANALAVEYKISVNRRMENLKKGEKMSEATRLYIFPIKVSLEEMFK